MSWRRHLPPFLHPLAEARGFELVDVEDGRWAGEPSDIVGVLGGMRVHVRWRTGWSLRLQRRLAPLGPLRLVAHSRRGRFLPLRDLRLDPRLVVRASDAHLAGWLLDARLRETIAATASTGTYRPAAIAIEGGVVEGQVELFADPDGLVERVIAAVDAVVTRSHALAARWTELAAAIGGTVVGAADPLLPGSAIEVIRPTGVATVGLRAAPLRTEVRAAAAMTQLSGLPDIPPLLRAIEEVLAAAPRLGAGPYR